MPRSWIGHSLGAFALCGAIGCADELAPLLGLDADSRNTTVNVPGSDAGTTADAAATDAASVQPGSSAEGSTRADASTRDPDASDDGRELDSAKIGPEGGTLATADDSASVHIPAGALKRATALTLTVVEPPPSDALLAVELGPTKTRFETPVTVTLSFAALDLSDVDLTRLVAARLDGREWLTLPNAALALQAHTLSLETSVAGVYGVLLGPELEANLDPPTASSGDGSCPARSCTEADAGPSSADAGAARVDAGETHPQSNADGGA